MSIVKHTDRVINEKEFELKPENSCQRDKILDKTQSSTFKQTFPHLKGQKELKDSTL